MRFGSVCSGIEAASVAFHDLGWQPAWLSEVDVAAAQVLAHRLDATAPVYPMDGKAEKRASKLDWGSSLTNWGDMTRLPDLIGSGEAEAPDVLCGGTPCQAFSNAGRRQGLADARGNLTLTFIDIADAIDEQRAQNDEQPCIIFWENVPGVLSSKDNAFGCFLAGLAGEDEPLVPAGKRWSDAGVVLGPQRAVAWRILDAQYFGLAQRRRRVFVVASAREGFDPGAILFEFEGVRRDSAPSRDSGQDVAGTPDARTSGGGFPGTDGACAGHVIPSEDGRIHQRGSSGSSRGAGADDRGPARVDSTHTQLPGWWDGSPVSQTLDAVLHKGQTMPEKNRFPAVLQPVHGLLK